MIERGSVVILNLANPTEKFWGVLSELTQVGVTFSGLRIEGFEDWMAQAASKDAENTGTIGLSTIFVPLFRVERMFLDERVGEVESYRERFERRVGVPLGVYLGMEGSQVGDPSDENSSDGA